VLPSWQQIGALFKGLERGKPELIYLISNYIDFPQHFNYFSTQ